MESTGVEPFRSVLDKSKTSLRMKYEAESRVIRRQIGSLEEVRQMLGLSQRKICQLLMVDPSAWTRWLRDESKVPPHIWRALQWYIELENKRPEWAQWREYVLARDREPAPRSKSQDERPVTVDLDPLREEWKSDLNQIRESQVQVEQLILKQQGLGFFWKVLLLLNTAFVAFQFVKFLF